MVLDVDPVADVLAVAVERHLLALEQVGDEQGDDLFGELVGAKVVGAAGDEDVEAKGVVVRSYQKVAGGFGGGVGTGGVDGGRFGEFQVRAVERELAVDLVGGDVNEATAARRVVRHSRTYGGDPGRGSFAEGVEQRLGAEDVGADEGGGIEDGAVDVAFGGEVDDGIRFGDEGSDGGGVADVAVDEAVARVGSEVGEILSVAGVGQSIKVGDAPVGALAQDEAHEVGADEAAAASDKDVVGHG